MSIHTPIFPKTNTQLTRLASSSSQSTLSTANIEGTADSTRLSQWHLALTSLPHELAPSSRPSSPSGESRVEKLRVKIREAVTNNGDLREIVKLNSVQFGGRADPDSYRRIDATDDDGPWPLFDTEEEWVAWEKDWYARRAAQPNDLKGKQREAISLKAQPSLSSREKVANWQAELQKVISLNPSNVSSTPPTSSQSKLATSGNALGFPVVKRAGTLKETKQKDHTAPSQTLLPPISSHNPKVNAPLAPFTHASKSPNNRVENVIVAPPVPTYELRLSQLPDASSLDLLDFSNDALTSTPKQAVVKTAIQRMTPVEVAMEKADDARSKDDERQFELAPAPSAALEILPAIHAEEDTTLTIPPPSFPSDIPTSTPRPDAMTPPSNQTPDNKDIREAESAVGLLNSSMQPDQMEVPVHEPVDCITPEKDDLQLGVIAAPPSPPDSSSSPPVTDSKQPKSAHETQAVDHVFHRMDEPDRQPTAPAKISRPLTPTSDDASQPTPKLPRTPERQTLRQHRSIPVPSSPSRRSNTITNSPTTLPTTPTSLTKSLGNAKGLPFPRTPDRNRNRGSTAPPLHIDLLATSRRSKLRPSTASQKSAASAYGDDEADVDAQLGSPSPTKSLFSSLASSSPISGSSGSSGPGSGSTGLMSIASRLSANRNAPREPESPLQFTQNPSRFAPPLESTQPFLNRHTFGSFARSPVSQPHSQTTQQRASLASKSDLNSQSRLERASSGLVGMAYSSQFNVNEHVHRVTDFIEKDVDFTAWVHDNDDEDIVEVGTSQTRPMADSQS